MRDDTSPQIGSYDVDAEALTGVGEPLVDLLARLGIADSLSAGTTAEGWRVLAEAPTGEDGWLIGAPATSTDGSWSVGHVGSARDGAPARVSFHPHALPVRPSVAERRGGLALRWPTITRELADVDLLSIDVVNEGLERWLPSGDTFDTVASIIPAGGGRGASYVGWTGHDNGTVALDPADYARVIARLDSGQWRELTPGPHDIVAYSPGLRLRSEPLRVDLTREVIEAHRLRSNPSPEPHDPRRASADRLRVLHAMRAGRDSVADVIAAISDAPDDATALSRIAALLECDTDSARAVYAMQLRRFRIGNADILAREIEDLERTLSSE